MIKSITAITGEIDDFELSVREIHDQLKLEESLMKNTVGILACHYEFVLSGAAKAVCDSLPFDVIGNCTTAQAVAAGSGALVLTIMVLTSDDVSFKAMLTEPLTGDFQGAIESGYRFAADALPSKPSLIFVTAPFMYENSGDSYVDVLSDISGGIPCFGTLGVDDTPDLRECASIFNGIQYYDRMAMLLLCGEVNPRFFIATISNDKILSQAALITASEGHLLKEVNGKPLVKYFENLGLRSASETSYAMTSLPFMVDYNDGTPPVSKVFIGLDEEGNGICAGKMPVGSSLYLGVFDKQDVLFTTGNAIEDAIQSGTGSNILIYSCISRNLSLNGDILAELELVRDKIVGKLPFMMVYSGGEICPTKISQNTATNRFHNNSFIVCVF